MSDFKQKLFDRLMMWHARKRESDRKGRLKRKLKKRFCKPRAGLFSFPKDKYEALQEATSVLGFTDQELRILFTLLGKASGGYLDFEIGGISVAFHTYGGGDSNEIELMVKVEEKEVSHTAEYSFNHELRSSLMNKRNFELS